MLVASGLLDESFLAPFTWKWFLTRVDPFVRDHIGSLDEGLPAELAGMFLILEMDLLMPSLGTLSGKFLSAHTAPGLGQTLMGFHVECVISPLHLVMTNLALHILYRPLLRDGRREKITNLLA